MGYGKTSKLGRYYYSTALRPKPLVLAVSVMVAVLMAVLFGARWTPSSDGNTWVSAGVRAVVSAGTC